MPTWSRKQSTRPAKPAEKAKLRLRNGLFRRFFGACVRPFCSSAVDQKRCSPSAKILVHVSLHCSMRYFVHPFRFLRIALPVNSFCANCQANDDGWGIFFCFGFIWVRRTICTRCSVCLTLGTLSLTINQSWKRSSYRWLCRFLLQ